MATVGLSASPISLASLLDGERTTTPIYSVSLNNASKPRINSSILLARIQPAIKGSSSWCVTLVYGSLATSATYSLIKLRMRSCLLIFAMFVPPVLRLCSVKAPEGVVNVMPPKGREKVGRRQGLP